MPIDPTDADIGRKVIYRAFPEAPPEEGVITSFNYALIFVRYSGDSHSKGTWPADLEWAFPPLPTRTSEGIEP